MTKKLNYIDLFAGAGGLSEGFTKAGYNPVAHVEIDSGACFTLKTRAAYHFLKKNNRISEYYDYLKGEISRKELYKKIPQELLHSVINAPIGKGNKRIFEKIDALKGKDKIDFIIGGPPCQAYSYIGRAALQNKAETDERNFLYREYGKFLKRYKPKFFVFENVPGIKTAGDGKHYKNLKRYFKKLGYNLDDRLVNAYDFGVIQNRERLIIIGWKEKIKFQYPKFRKLNHVWNRDNIFKDLPPIKPGHTQPLSFYSKKKLNDYLLYSEIRNGVDFVTQHITRIHNKKDLAIYKMAIKKLNKEGKRLKNNEIPEEARTQENIEDFLDRFKVVDKKPHTMIAHISKDGHHFIHPDLSQLRSISVREAARIQSFPDDYFFESYYEGRSRTAAFTQIGNAVPPLLSWKIAKTIYNRLNGQH